MSIATDLTRLQTAKADLKTAIEGKGVTVPSATKIDGYADLVDAIQTGGGGTDHLAELANNTLTTYSSTEMTSTSEYEFYKKTALQSVYLPNLLVIASNCFQDCTGLTGYLRFDSATNLNGSSFKNTRVVSAEFPKVNYIGWSESFRADTALELIRLGVSNTSLGRDNNMGQNWFYSCTNFKTLIIGYTNRIVSLGNINNFNNTPFASGGTGGTLYVPSAMISSYQAATNWSTILGYANNQILPIEGSIYETQYADGTPIT